MRKFIKSLCEGDKVDDFFVVLQREKREARTGNPYLSVAFSDASGTIGSTVFDDVERLFAVLEPNTVVKITGSVACREGKPQLKIFDARPLKKDDKIDFSALRPVSPYDVEAMFAELESFRKKVKDPFVKKLLAAFFDDPDFVREFKTHTAAKAMHHAAIGGLLEHTLGVVRLADSFSDLYPKLDRDLMIAGAMLHDIGKLYEMGGLIATEYTTAGRLLGHIVIGSELVGKACDKIEGFPETTKIQLQHIIVSHHGKLEFGSPCLPQTPEAMALFRADEFDSHIYQAFRAIGEESEQAGDFTSRVKGLDTALYKTEAAKDGAYSMAFPQGGKVEEPSNEEPEVSDSAPMQDDLFK
ncbi:HD domain-containing protein [bacterium]|nr:HD domain-containing protein [bacterium]